MANELRTRMEVSIVLEKRRAKVRESLYFLEQAIAAVEDQFPKTERPGPHRLGLRNLKLWCAPGSALEREITDAIRKEIVS